MHPMARRMPVAAGAGWSTPINYTTYSLHSASSSNCDDTTSLITLYALGANTTIVEGLVLYTNPQCNIPASSTGSNKVLDTASGSNFVIASGGVVGTVTSCF